jgi:hypothetical protein
MENKSHVPNHQPDDFHHFSSSSHTISGDVIGPALSCFLQ